MREIVAHGNVTVHPQNELWSCTTCATCGIRCPKDITPYEFLIDIKLLIFAFNNIAGHSDYPFNKIFLGIHGILKYYDVSSFGCFDWNDLFLPVRNFNPIDEFINQDMITDLECFFH